jgi:hypothetical protein
MDHATAFSMARTELSQKELKAIHQALLSRPINSLFQLNKWQRVIFGKRRSAVTFLKMS